MSESQPNTFEIIAGGARIEALLLSGESQPVVVRYVSIREMDALDAVVVDEPSLIEFFCRQEKGWADTLNPESYETILQKGKELNFPIRDRWLARSVATLREKARQLKSMGGALPEAMQPLYEAEMNKVERQLLLSSAQISSPVEFASPSASSISPPATS